MHPHLSPHKHPDCADLIEKFQACHAKHPFLKFFGVCNDAKAQLDACFRQEKVVRRKVNFDKAKESKERLRKRREAEEAAGVPRWTEILEEKSSGGQQS